MKWTHSHSGIAGILLALAAERHALLFLSAAFVAGIVVGRAWAGVRSLLVRRRNALQRM